MTPGQRTAYDRLPTTIRGLADVAVVFAAMSLDDTMAAIERVEAAGLYYRPGQTAVPVDTDQLYRQRQLVDAAITYRDACVRLADEFTAATQGPTP